ncbi:MAG: hypothetical protein Fur0010_15900 [Bdellovibrio sp.]
MSLFFLFFLGDVYARFFVDIEMNAKRVIDQNLKLASEVHVTKEIIDQDQITEVAMRNGYRLQTQIKFLEYSEKPEEIGPSHMLRVKSKIFDPKGLNVGEKEVFEQTVNLGEPKEWEVQTNDLLFTIKITPYLK